MFDCHFLGLGELEGGLGFGGGSSWNYEEGGQDVGDGNEGMSGVIVGQDCRQVDWSVVWELMGPSEPGHSGRSIG